MFEPIYSKHGSKSDRPERDHKAFRKPKRVKKSRAQEANDIRRRVRTNDWE
jgi:hypothetical protein